MVHSDLIIQNLTSPAVIAFLIGVLATLLKSDLRVPSQALETISMYLLLSIGLKGGIALEKSGFIAIINPFIATIALGIICPFIAFFAARAFGKLSTQDAAGLSAHYGSVSAVTFIAAVNFALISKIQTEPYLTALLVVLEIPGIVIGISLAKIFDKNANVPIKHIIFEAFTGKSIILLLCGLIIGYAAPRAAITDISKVFIDPFQGVLVFFLLELGLVAAQKLRDSNVSLRFLLGYGTLMPLLFGGCGALAGVLAGMNAGGAGILATMTASASYIAAPAAVKMALPKADHGLFITLSVGTTLPFNIIIGIPLYFQMAEFLATTIK